MNRILAFAAALLAVGAAAAAPRKPLSPHQTVSAVVDGDALSVVYGRPYTKSPKTGEVRRIWGGLVPYGKVWRTGADEATLFTTKKALALGGAAIPAGTYSLFTLPSRDGSAVLIVNKQTGQWGLTYDEKQDLARVPLTRETLEKSVDQFTMAIDKGAAGGGVLSLSWENARYSAPFTVKN